MRKPSRTKKKVLASFSALLNRLFPSEKVDDLVGPQVSALLDEMNDLGGARILEIGGRNVTGADTRDRFKGCGEYVGFDIHEGENVDVVGDAHKLSRYFPPDHFDVVLSLVVFEHLAMPWKVVLEINRVMKIGGLLSISAPGIWSPHQLPWDFWRYLKGSFEVLLNGKTGFEILKCEELFPCSIVPHFRNRQLASMPRSENSLILCVLARKTRPPDERLSWDVEVEDILNTAYPKGRSAVGS
jgi:SAM-dependent methyltransferase